MELRLAKEVSLREIERHRLRHYRPGCKALLFNRASAEVLIGRLPEGYPARFNLMGGGVDPFEKLPSALVREVSEEVCGPTLSLVKVNESPILVEGILPFPRDGYVGKYEYIIGLSVTDLSAYKTKNDSKLILYPPMPVYKAIDFLQECPNMDKDSANLYLAGLEKLLFLIEG